MKCKYCKHGIVRIIGAGIFVHTRWINFNNECPYCDCTIPEPNEVSK